MWGISSKVIPLIQVLVGRSGRSRNHCPLGQSLLVLDSWVTPGTTLAPPHLRTACRDWEKMLPALSHGGVRALPPDLCLCRDVSLRRTTLCSSVIPSKRNGVHTPANCLWGWSLASKGSLTSLSLIAAFSPPGPLFLSLEQSAH